MLRSFLAAQYLQSNLYLQLCYISSIPAAQAVRKAPLLRVMRNPQQSSPQQVEEGQTHPHTAQEQLPSRHEPPWTECAEEVTFRINI